ncbi:hypothetical protein [Pseudomonas yamanorum]|uniref:hypothetical protein n=1 Tax=Pseudomonas yamanorum TaxID=515393 RepID=UPI00087AFCC7|nr:hypothetical protein [Pseudomonas yamanorum]SDT99477.1 hypothetical protein SAMN05216237_1185 [Pseudomonas yamanorum]
MSFQIPVLNPLYHQTNGTTLDAPSNQGALRSQYNNLTSLLSVTTRDHVAHGSSQIQGFKQYSDKSLLMELRNNFDVFRDGSWTGYMTQGKLREFANRSVTGQFSEDRLTGLAQEILSRPGLNDALDNDFHGSKVHDGWIHSSNLDIAIHNANDTPPSPRPPLELHASPHGENMQGMSRGAMDLMQVLQAIQGTQQGMHGIEQGLHALISMLGMHGMQPLQNLQAMPPSSLQRAVSEMSDRTLTNAFINNFDDFNDGYWTNHMSQSNLRSIANQPETGQFAKDMGIYMARELMSRPVLNR